MANGGQTSGNLLEDNSDLGCGIEAKYLTNPSNYVILHIVIRGFIVVFEFVTNVTEITAVTSR